MKRTTHLQPTTLGIAAQWADSCLALCGSGFEQQASALADVSKTQ